MVVAVVLIFVQVQHLVSKDASLSVVVSRNYVISMPQNSLTALGVNLQITEFPDPQTQLLTLGSEETRRQISERLGFTADVRTPDEWSSPLSFECEKLREFDCELATDAYVAKLVEIRRQAIENGVKNLARILTDAQSVQESVVVGSQLQILDSLAKNVVVEAVFVNSSTETVQNSLGEMSRRTILTAFVAALVIAVVILLQLTYSDNRVRSTRQLIRLVGEESLVGTASAKTNAVNERRAAIALRRNLGGAGSMSLRFLPLRSASSDEATFAHLANLAGAGYVISAPFAQLSVPELIDVTPGQSDVIVVKRNHDLRNDVVEAVTALRRSERLLIGVLLVD